MESIKLLKSLEKEIAKSYKLSSEQKPNAISELIKCHSKIDKINKELGRNWGIRYSLERYDN